MAREPIGGRNNDAYPELRKRLGLVPEDTEFNRRAAQYAAEAFHWCRMRAHRLGTACMTAIVLDGEI